VSETLTLPKIPQNKIDRLVEQFWDKANEEF
jgi:hypothetical protein